GGSNNDQDIWYKTPAESAAQTQERTERTQADVDWLNAAFTRAKTDGAEGVVVFEQADMWDLDGKAPAHIAGYKPFIDAIAAGATSFGGPTLLYNGDSHVYRSDNPFVNNSPCQTESGTCGDDAYDNQSPNGIAHDDVTNVHRITVHGSTFP